MPKGIYKHQKGRRWKTPPMLGKKHTEETKQKMRLAHKGFKHTEETKQKISGIHKGKNFSGVKNGENTRFKPTGCRGRELLGKNRYRNLHKWVVRQLGQPTKCSKCGRDGLTGRQIHWANKSGDYKKDIKDWERLCVKCHFKKDKSIKEVADKLLKILKDSDTDGIDKKTIEFKNKVLEGEAIY